MIVISLTNCPVSLRGDLTKWLLEINTGVFVGRVSARVRDRLWERITDNIKDGRATLVYSANNEQHMNFCIHNSENEIVDFDGLKLVLQPSKPKPVESNDKRLGFSKAARWRKIGKTKSLAQGERRTDSNIYPENYVIVDIETSGLSEQKNEIIEIGMLRVRKGEVVKEFQSLVKPSKRIPRAIEILTGITNAMLDEAEYSINSLTEEIRDFIGHDIIIGHNIRFDLRFLNHAFMVNNQPQLNNEFLDTMEIYAKVTGAGNGRKKLSSMVEEFKVEEKPCHRALSDCKALKAVYDVLKEK